MYVCVMCDGAGEGVWIMALPLLGYTCVYVCAYGCELGVCMCVRVCLGGCAPPHFITFVCFFKNNAYSCMCAYTCVYAISAYHFPGGGKQSSGYLISFLRRASR